MTGAARPHPTPRQTGRRGGPRGGRERLPVPALILALIAIAFFALPFAGLLWRAPWGDVWDVASEPKVRKALLLSIRTSLTSMGFAVVFGVPLAWLLARVEFRGRSMVRALCTLSMVLPPVVAGVALFFSFGRRGLFGQYLDRWFDFRLPFTTWGVVMAQTFVAMPFLVLTVEAGLRQLDRRYEDAARTLGGTRWYVFRRVTLPAVRPALMAGAVLAWARALGEFGATITFAGNFPGTTQTMPLATYLALETDPQEALVLSLILVAVSFAVLVGLRERWLGGMRAAPGSGMSLEATVEVRRGTFELAVEIAVAPGEVLALLGPNGAGKTTVLRSVAGLVALERGSVRIDGEVMDDPAGDVFVPVERRPIGVVFQDYLLFQHLSALENVAFGLRARGVKAAEARRRATSWLERVGLGEHIAKRPQQLSGGQSQRVALARALATDPRVLLLDEPLAALDVGTRGEVRRDLRRYMASFDGMRVLVTHDPVDAYALADRIAVLEAGSVVQCGTIADITAHPRSRYVADLVGVNLVAGVAAGDTITAANGAQVSIADRHAGPVFAAIAPTAVALALHAPDGASARNVWEGTVADIDRLGDRARVVVDGPVPITAEVTTRALTALRLQPGDRVFASVKATEITVYPA